MLMQAEKLEVTDFDAVTVPLGQCGVSLDQLLTAEFEAFSWRSPIVHQEYLFSGCAVYRAPQLSPRNS